MDAECKKESNNLQMYEKNSLLVVGQKVLTSVTLEMNRLQTKGKMNHTWTLFYKSLSHGVVATNTETSISVTWKRTGSELNKRQTAGGGVLTV